MDINKAYFEKIMKSNAGALVGKACARIEEIFDYDKDGNLIPKEDRKNLSDLQKFKLIKSALRNLIPESFRDAGFQIGCYSEGKEIHKIEFKRNDNPTDSK